MKKNTEIQAEKINTLLKSIIKNFHRHLYDRICTYGITVPQLMLLREVYINPEISIRELSEKLGLAKSTVSGIVDRLERQGAVSRVRDENDRRVVKIKMEPKSLAIRETLVAIKTNYLANLIKGLAPQETDMIVDSLNKLNELMEGSEE